MSCRLGRSGRSLGVRCRSSLLLPPHPSAAFSQSSVCHPIRGGETATQLARRITGEGRNTYQPWFQIMDASSRFVPKSQYDRIRPGWRACIVKEATKAVVPPALNAKRSTQPRLQPVRVPGRRPPPSSAMTTSCCHGLPMPVA